MGKRKRSGARKSGWRQWKAGEARRVLEAWGASGMTMAAFAQKRGLSADRLRWWRQRLGDREEVCEAPVGLVPAVVTGHSSVMGGATVTLRASGDVVVEVAEVEAVPVAWLSALVSGLRRPTP